MGLFFKKLDTRFKIYREFISETIDIITLIDSLFSERVGSTIIIKGDEIRAFFLSAWKSS